jgi:hypothetical protein
MLETPVVFFVFNRPRVTREVWIRIRDARPRRLFIVADGPRVSRPDDAAHCAEVLDIVAKADWPCEVQRDYSPKNLGAAVRVSTGLDWVFGLVEDAIILEDDCVPDPTFFPFCAELLERYREDSRVAQIAGCSFQPPAAKGTSYYFSVYPHGWGWATWRRAWRLYDHSMKTWRTERGGSWLSAAIQHPVERKMWERSFENTLSGRVDAWDYRWTLAVWHASMLSILPYRNLISNIGFGPEATHTTAVTPWTALPTVPMPFPLVHPQKFVRDIEADAHTSKTVFRPPSWQTRLGRRWKRFFCR